MTWSYSYHRPIGIAAVPLSHLANHRPRLPRAPPCPLLPVFFGHLVTWSLAWMLNTSGVQKYWMVLWPMSYLIICNGSPDNFKVQFFIFGFAFGGAGGTRDRTGLASISLFPNYIWTLLYKSRWLMFRVSMPH